MSDPETEAVALKAQVARLERELRIANRSRERALDALADWLRDSREVREPEPGEGPLVMAPAFVTHYTHRVRQDGAEAEVVLALMIDSEWMPDLLELLRATPYVTVIGKRAGGERS